jgi:hypothetical protein
LPYLDPESIALSTELQAHRMSRIVSARYSITRPAKIQHRVFPCRDLAQVENWRGSYLPRLLIEFTFFVEKLDHLKSAGWVIRCSQKIDPADTIASASPVRHLHSILNLKLGRDVAQGLRG